MLETVLIVAIIALIIGVIGTGVYVRRQSAIESAERRARITCERTHAMEHSMGLPYSICSNRANCPGRAQALADAGEDRPAIGGDRPDRS